VPRAADPLQIQIMIGPAVGAEMGDPGLHGRGRHFEVGRIDLDPAGALRGLDGRGRLRGDGGILSARGFVRKRLRVIIPG
jgi:hypothetical protein